MKSLIKFPILLSMLAIYLVSCQFSQQETEQVEQEEVVEKETPSQQEKLLGEKSEDIKKQLLAYYQDLAKEKINASDYYAPTVQTFFNQKNVSRDQIQKSLENGFKTVENRSLALNETSLQVTQEGETFEAKFSGKVSYTKSSDKSKVEETFTNRVTFNPDLQILSYESIDASQLVTEDQPEPARKVANKATASEEELFQGHLATFLQAWQNGKSSIAQEYIHPKIGFYYITRPGAMDAVYHGTSFESVFKEAYTPWVPGLMKQISCTPAFENLPEFDCESFSKEGCFAEKPTKYNRASQLMKALTQSKVGKFSKEMDRGVEEAEALVTYQVVATDQAVSMSWGNIKGNWYLLFLDVATYDCSA